MSKMPKHLQGKNFAANPQNRNTKGIKGPRGFRSELRKLANKLKEREEIALEIIDASLKGGEASPDKDRVQTAKWIVERIVAVTTAAISEETRKLAIKKSLDDPEGIPEEDNSAGETEKPKRFSLTMMDGGKKDE